jgi:hypothetical protein
MPAWISPNRENRFPNLTRGTYEKKSDESGRYNCIAFAVGDAERWWEPPIDGILDPGQYWPKGAPTDCHVSSYAKAYELHGFELYNEEIKGFGFETVALYAHRDGEITHAARLNEYGSWDSKLGDWEDIRHDYLIGLEGDRPAYGYVRFFMRRIHPQ